MPPTPTQLPTGKWFTEEAVGDQSGLCSFMVMENTSHKTPKSPEWLWLIINKEEAPRWAELGPGPPSQAQAEEEYTDSYCLPGAFLMPSQEAPFTNRVASASP